MSIAPPDQRGTALLLLLLAIILGGAAAGLSHVHWRVAASDRDRVTVDALAQAKAALIGYAASVEVDRPGALWRSRRPGDLPCPDMDNDGIGEALDGCGNGAGTTGQHLRLGRLPWKDLGLPDLRDGSGERLWYAVSAKFKHKTRHNAPLNSDTAGTITIRDARGRVIFDGSAAAGTGVVAVLIAPGAPLARPAGIGNRLPYLQERSGGGANLPVNFLDTGLGEDNAAFIDGSASDGFIAGPVVDTSGAIVVNDRLLWITPEELAPHLEKRVVAEVVQCLRTYGKKSGERYPWPAAGSLGTAGPVNFLDSANHRFGRLPDTPFDDSKRSAPDLNEDWTGDCNIMSDSGWWLNWKESIFYAVADQHKPAASPPASRCGVAGHMGSGCLSLNGKSDRQYVVLAAGRRLAVQGQERSSAGHKNDPANYLEGANRSDDDSFASIVRGAGSNDVLKGGP